MNVNIKESYFSGKVFTIGRLVRIKKFVESMVICGVGFNNKFYNFR